MNNRIYIQGMGMVSPQKSWEELGAAYESSYLPCLEPAYSEWLEPQQMRRMSRIMKMGVTSAKMALKDASLERPDAIITGTGYGCLEDTATFLTKITTHKEEALNPTPFMQSTHNTIGSQIALILQCRGYNQTYTHQAFSFEHALQDALMLLAENPEQTILVGGVDEFTEVSHTIQSRFGKYRKDPVNNLSLLSTPSKGTLAGEGAACFILSGKQPSGAAVAVQGVQTFYRAEEWVSGIEAFLRQHELTPDDVDMLLAGTSGDAAVDHRFDPIISSLFKKTSVGVFKHLCGEYCVASSFALWLGAMILIKGEVPPVVLQRDMKRAVRSLLISNAYFQDHHTLILLKACHDTK